MEENKRTLAPRGAPQVLVGPPSRALGLATLRALGPLAPRPPFALPRLPPSQGPYRSRIGPPYALLGAPRGYKPTGPLL